jgi:hypothetical protein
MNDHLSPILYSVHRKKAMLEKLNFYECNGDEND